MSPKASTRLLGTQSDERLVELVVKGHERAFEALVHRYRRSLLGYCRRLGLSDSRAEDAVQHALLKAWLALQAGTEVRQLRPWLFRIVHNTAINVLRSAPREQAMAEEESGVVTGMATAASELEGRTAARDALREVAGLPPMQREAILLTAIEGRSHQEVAGALGISHGAVRGLLYRARASLRGAAAAMIPLPVLEWACGRVSRMAPTAARLGELSAGGGGEAGSLLAKGAALAVTAALAAGAVLGPLHHPAARASSSPDPDTSLGPQAIRQEAATTRVAGRRGGGDGSYVSSGDRTFRSGGQGEMSTGTVAAPGPVVGGGHSGGGSSAGSSIVSPPSSSPVSGPSSPAINGNTANTANTAVGRSGGAGTGTSPAPPVQPAPGSGSGSGSTGSGAAGEPNKEGDDGRESESGRGGDGGEKGGDGAEKEGSDDGAERGDGGKNGGGSGAGEAEATKEHEAEEAAGRAEHEAEARQEREAEEAERARDEAQGNREAEGTRDN